jgi:hypothetical protein
MRFHRDPRGSPQAVAESAETLLAQLLQIDLADRTACRALLAALEALLHGQAWEQVWSGRACRLDMGPRITLIEPLATTDAEPGAIPTRALRDLVIDWLRFLESRAPPARPDHPPARLSRSGPALDR